MSATRTQVYFTERQRAALDAIAAREGRTLADVVREAVDQYLEHGSADPEAILSSTFGAIRDFPDVDRGDWERGYG